MRGSGRGWELSQFEDLSISIVARRRGRKEGGGVCQFKRRRAGFREGGRGMGAYPRTLGLLILPVPS